MTSATQKQTLLRQQVSRDRHRRLTEGGAALRASIAFLSPGIVFLWGWAAGSLVSFAPAPVKLAAAGLMILVAGRLLWRAVRKGRRR